MSGGTFLAVVLGAVLATAGGIATELWKQRRERRAAARLVWLELVAGYFTLLVSVANDEWPTKFAFPDEAWKAHRDRLALGSKISLFEQLETAYLAFANISATPRAELGDPVLQWPVLVAAHGAARELGEVAGIEPASLDGFRTPVETALAETRAQLENLRGLAGEDVFTQAVADALNQFPPELRARAAEAFARQRKTARRATTTT
jgi:hypothetical protein